MIEPLPLATLFFDLHQTPGIADSKGSPATARRSLPGVDVLQDGLDHMRAIRTGKEDQAILEFNASHKQVKEAVKRAAELKTTLTDPHLHDLGRAKAALGTFGHFSIRRKTWTRLSERTPKL